MAELTEAEKKSQKEATQKIEVSADRLNDKKLMDSYLVQQEKARSKK